MVGNTKLYPSAQYKFHGAVSGNSGAIAHEGNIVISVGLFDIRCEVMRDARYCEAGVILKAL